MRLRRIICTALILIFTTLTLIASAHPGRTDTQGGHMDTDTESYHYHHGWPAHDHYDMNDDGVIDCPYEFVDAEDDKPAPSYDKSSNSPNSSNNSGKYENSHITIDRLKLSQLPTPTPSAIPISSISTGPASDIIAILLSLSFLIVPILIIALYESSFYLEKEHPRLSSSLGYVATALLLLTLPISGLGVIGFFNIAGNRKKKQSSLISKAGEYSQTAPSTKASPLPPETFTKPDPDVEFRPVLMPETEVSVHTRCRDTCRYLWYETLMLRSSTTPPISSDTCVYLWTALFYTAVKTLRNQSSVDRIYSYFAEVTGEFVTEEQYTELVIAKVRETYRNLRPALNSSGIDPRSGNARLALWNLLISTNQELLQRPDVRPYFLAAAERVWKTVADVFPQSHPYPKAGEVQYSIREDLNN